MSNPECAFCDTDIQEERRIRIGRHFFSIISKPWFRPGHSLVIPKRHVTTIAELWPKESAEIMTEIGRLSLLLDQGHGTGMMQKYQPMQNENGIKMNHAHFHVFGRLATEENLFPVPEPNNFDGFYDPSPEEIASIVNTLK